MKKGLYQSTFSNYHFKFNFHLPQYLPFTLDLIGLRFENNTALLFSTDQFNTTLNKICKFSTLQKTLA